MMADISHIVEKKYCRRKKMAFCLSKICAPTSGLF